MLEKLFGSRTRVKLLRLFFLNAEQEFFVREITRRVGERINSVRRELKNLEDLGLVQPIQKDRKKFFRVNADSVLYPELRALILKTRVSLEKRLITSVEEVGKVKYMVLTGVFTGVKNVPTDLLIVGQVNRQKLDKLIQRFEEDVNTTLNYTVMTAKEYQLRRDITDKFLYDILENKKIIAIDRLNALNDQDEL